jgi:formiminoglutamase
MCELKYYSSEHPSSWSGRIDDREDIDSFRWHQLIEFIDLNKTDMKPIPEGERGFCFLGYCCDCGVKENLGRVGSDKAPSIIRRELSNHPRSIDDHTQILDGGNIICPEDDLDQVSRELSTIVEKMLSLNLFPIILGGGHDLAYGHYRGIRKALDKKGKEPPLMGIISFDAHFDLRPYKSGPSSGSMFTQIADEYAHDNTELPLFYLGIQKTGNTLALFKRAEEIGAQYIFAKDIADSTLPDVVELLDGFLAKNDYVYLTICADVFSSAYAPGVSAPQPFGLHPETALKLIKHIVGSGKIISFDIAEVLPRFDEDNRTAKLAAIIIFAVINKLSGSAFYGKE